MSESNFPQLLESLQSVSRSLPTQSHELDPSIQSILAHLVQVSQTCDAQSLSVIWHEIRNPLSVIQTSIDLLNEPSTIADPQRSQRHLERIQTKIRQIHHLLENATVLFQTPNSAICRPQIMDLIPFCRNLIEEMQQNHTQHEIMFSCRNKLDHQDWSIVSIDPQLLAPVLVNVLANAIKYSPKAHQVFLQLIREPDRIIFRIRDQGIGIPSEEQFRIFDWLYRASNAQTMQGIGLGLAIVQRYVSLQNGAIDIESEVNQGTQVTIRIPLHSSAIV